MTNEQFKNLLSGSRRRIIVAGILVTLTGAGIFSGIVLDENKISYWIIGGILLLLGIPVLFVAIKGLLQLNSGQLPLLKAIYEKEMDYAVWIYENQIVQKVKGINAGKSYNIVIYNKYGRQEQIVLGRKAPVNEVIAYLSANFPGAYVGYSDDTREAVSAFLKKKI